MAKRTTTGKELALTQGGLPADLLKMFEPHISKQAAAAKTVTTGVLKVSTKGGQFKLGERLFGKEIDLVVLGSISENVYYKGAFVDGENVTPDCFALGFDDQALIPHKDSPAIQGGPVPDGPPANGDGRTCGKCWANAFGTATRSPSGRGKACQNGFRLAVIHPEELPQIEAGKLLSPAVLRIPATSRKSWGEFQSAILDGRALGQPVALYAPVIRFTIQPKGGAWEIIPMLLTNQAGQPVPSFKNAAMVEKLVALADAAEGTLTQPYAASGPRDAKKPGRRASSGTEKRYVKPKHKARR